MKRSGLEKISIALVAACILCSGCTGTNMTVNPEPESLKMNVVKRCGAVAVKETPADHVYPPAGNLVPGFATALEKSGIVEKVYYPARPDDKVDLTLDAKFDVLFDANAGGNMAKSFFTGFTFFLLEPVMWFNFDYNLTGKVDISQEKTLAKTLQAGSQAEMSMKFLSLSEAQRLEGDTLNKAKEALYKQLLQEMCNYCNK